MSPLDPTTPIVSWHARICFDATSRDRAMWPGRSHELNLAALGA